MKDFRAYITGLAGSALLFLCTGCASHTPGNAVVNWNQMAMRTLLNVHAGALEQSRSMALVQVAVYDAANSITGETRPYVVRIQPAHDASLEAASVGAAYSMLQRLYPQQRKMLDAAFRHSLDALPKDTGVEQGIRTGARVAALLYRARLNDGTNIQDSYAFKHAVGAWVPTPPDYLQADEPGWARSKPWCMRSAQQFRPPPPPRLTSAVYQRDLRETALFGVAQGARRSAQQTAIAQFWQHSGTEGWNEAARGLALDHHLGTMQTARLFALLDMATADALLASWDGKYHYGFWRPVTAIRYAATHGTRGYSQRYSAWLPFLGTPNFPEYPGAHSEIAGAAAEVLKHFFPKVRNYQIRMTSRYLPKVTLVHDDVDDVVREVNDARVYAGVHYRHSCEVGSAMGRNIGRYVLKQMEGGAR